MPPLRHPTTPTWRDEPRRHGLLVAALSEVTRFDPGALALVPGARVAVGVVAALAIGLVAGDHATGATLAAGALLTGIPTVVGPQRVSLTALIAISLSMAVAVFLGSVTGSIDWLHIAVLAPVCILGALLLGQRAPAGSVGSQAIVAMIVFGRFAAPPRGALALAGYVLAGSGVAFTVLALTRPPLTAGAQRAALADAARSLAALASSPAGRRNGIASAECIEAAEQLLVRQLGDRRDHEALRALLDVLRRARLAVLAIDGVERRMQRTRPEGGEALAAAADDHLRAAAARLEEVAAALVGENTAGADSTAAVPQFIAGERPSTEAAVLREHVEALEGQLRAALDLARDTGTGRWAFNLRGALSPPRGARRRGADFIEGLVADASLASPVGRHALRLAVVICIAEVLALSTALGRGYWVALTAAIVLRPEFSTTIGRGVARTVGTSLGVLLAGLLALAVHTIDPADVVAIGVLTMLTSATFRVSYVVFSGLLTGLVVLLVGIVTPGTLTTALDRLFDTVIGGALALLAYGLWPTWTRTTGPRALADLVERQVAYLGAVLAMVTGSRPREPAALSALSRAARRARSVAQSVIAEGLLEPERRRLDVARSQGSLAALSRISLTTHALRSELESGAAKTAPAIGPLADALMTALSRIGEELRREQGDTALERFAPRSLRRPAPGAEKLTLPPLRRLYREAVAEPSAALSPVLLAECDELVDAIDTLGDVLGLAPSHQEADET